MGGIITFIVFLFIILSAVKNAKQNQENARKKQAEQRVAQARTQRRILEASETEHAQGNDILRRAKMNVDDVNRHSAKSAKEQEDQERKKAAENKERLQKKYGKSEGSMTRKANASVAGMSAKARSASTAARTTDTMSSYEYGSAKKSNTSAKPAYTAAQQKQREQLAGVEADDGAILAAAKMHSYDAEQDNDVDSMVDLMQPVYNLMIMGPDTSIAFERDFVGEAVEMLNAYE